MHTYMIVQKLSTTTHLTTLQECLCLAVVVAVQLNYSSNSCVNTKVGGVRCDR